MNLTQRARRNAVEELSLAARGRLWREIGFNRLKHGVGLLPRFVSNGGSTLEIAMSQCVEILGAGRERSLFLFC